MKVPNSVNAPLIRTLFYRSELLRSRLQVLTALFAGLVGCESLSAQGFGAYPGQPSRPSGMAGTAAGGVSAPLSPETALNYITIQGTAEIRVEPEVIRLVLAVTSEANSADQCMKENTEQIRAVRAEWNKLKIPEDNVVEDFISVLPVYSWHRETRDGREVRIQKQTSYRMQSNLHLAVNTEEQAMKAISGAFSQGISDIITFDYWSSELEAKQQQAREAAVAAAKKKAETLLAAFDQRPPLINIQEQTRTLLPHSLYRSFENILEETELYSREAQNLPQIKAYRPKMTFFDGSKENADSRPDTVALKPSIAIISTVTLYYQSPATKTPPSSR